MGDEILSSARFSTRAATMYDEFVCCILAGGGLGAADVDCTPPLTPPPPPANAGFRPASDANKQFLQYLVGHAPLEFLETGDDRATRVRRYLRGMILPRAMQQRPYQVAQCLEGVVRDSRVAIVYVFLVVVVFIVPPLDLAPPDAPDASCPFPLYLEPSDLDLSTWMHAMEWNSVAAATTNDHYDPRYSFSLSAEAALTTAAAIAVHPLSIVDAVAAVTTAATMWAVGYHRHSDSSTNGSNGRRRRGELPFPSFLL